MRDLFQQDRAISPSSVRTATTLIGTLFAACLGLIILQALLGAFGVGATGTLRRALTGLMQIGLGAGLLLALYMMVRLLGEGLMAQQRLIDRMTILSDELGSVRVVEKPVASKPAATKPAAKSATASKPKT